MMSNVARQELETMTALDRVYAAPAVPVAVLAVKDKAYAQNYLWLTHVILACKRGTKGGAVFLKRVRVFPSCANRQ